MKNFNSFTKKANWLKTFNFKQTLNQNNMKKSFSLFVLLSALFGGWSGVVAQIPVHPPTTTNSSCCGLGSLTLTASGADSSEIYKWYDNPTAGTLLLSDTAHTAGYVSTYTVNLSVTDTFWVAIDSAGYQSVRVPAIGFVFSPGQTVTDTINKFIHDGRDCQNYPIAKIGNQWWMKENLNVGTMITSSTFGQLQTDNSIIEKYCYNNIPANCEVYGGLYEWYETMQYIPSDTAMLGTTQGVCPTGWHIPTDLEWSLYEYCIENNIAPTGATTLATFQTAVGWRGTNSTAGPGAKMKVTSSDTPAWDGTNTSGFSAFPAGYREFGDGSFDGLGSGAYFWSATEGSGTSAWVRYLATGSSQSFRVDDPKSNGFSVRCLQN